MVAIAATGDPRDWADDLAGPELPLVVGFASEARDHVEARVPDRTSWCSVSAPATPLGVWPRVASVLANRTDVGFASPFLRTIPGTDTYVDEL